MTVREFVLGSKLRLIMLISIVLISHNITGIIVTAVIMAFLIPLFTALINMFFDTFELFDTLTSKVATWLIGLTFVLYIMYFVFNLPKVIMMIFSIIVAIITSIYIGIKYL